MHLTKALFALSLAAAAAAQDIGCPAFNPKRSNGFSTPEPDTKKYILEFAEGEDFDAAVKEFASQDGVTVLKHFKSPIFTGVVIEAIKESTERLQAHPKVANAWTSRQVKLPKPIDITSFSGGIEATNYSVHSMTGVDKAHAAGILGKGARIAIVDTGIDYNHPDLGGGLGSGFKVAIGHDFVGDGDWPCAAKNPDEDPMDQFGHGTHVAGIVAANGSWLKGVAPEATLLAYKVFTTYDYTDDETLVDAFLRAYADGADVITCSVGDIDGWGTGAWATVASRLVDEGVVVTIAAGNEGESGPFRASSGASGNGVLAVASVDPSTLIGLPAEATLVSVNGTTDVEKVAWRPGLYLPPTTTWTDVPVWPLTFNTTAEIDACGSLPADTPDLSNVLVLVRESSECYTEDQAANILPFNPLGIAFYHNEGVDYGDPYAVTETPLLMFTADAGKAMVETIAAGGNVTLNFNIDGYVNMPTGFGFVPSFYSSWGPKWDLDLKPEIAAPGALITSTYPLSMGGYATLSGTSMATPYIAGVAALYIGLHGGRSVHGKDFAKLLHARIMSSGASLWFPGNVADGLEHLASPVQMGTGLVDAGKVLNYTTQLSFTKFLLNDTHHWARYQKVDITNNGPEDVTYTFKVEDAGGFDAFATEQSREAWAPVMTDLRGVHMYTFKTDVSLPSGTFKVKAGQTRTAQFNFAIPDLVAGHIGADMPILSGKVIITSSKGEQLSVPYFGMVSDLKQSMRSSGMYWRGIGWPRLVTGSGPGAIPDVWTKPYWGFNLSDPWQDFPILETATTYGVRELRWDIYEPGWTERKWEYPPVVGENGYIGSATYWAGSQSEWFNPETDDPNDIIAMPAQYLWRQQLFEYMWFGQLTNGSKIAPGNYTMRIAALQPFGEHTNADNWDVMDLPEVMILKR